MEKLSDSELIRLYIEGNTKALDGIINRYTKILYRFIFNLTKDENISYDIVQETFIKVWKNIKKFDTDKNYKTWLFTIAKRTTIDYLRKRKDINFSEIINDNDTDFEEKIIDEELLPDEIFEKEEWKNILKEAFEKISLENKMIILLHNNEEMTFEEISQIIEKPLNTVKSLYHRSLINLRKIIESNNAPK